MAFIEGVLLHSTNYGEVVTAQYWILGISPMVRRLVSKINFKVDIFRNQSNDKTAPQIPLKYGYPSPIKGHSSPFTRNQQQSFVLSFNNRWNKISK